MISPLLESVAPDVYATYEQDHLALDAAFATLNQSVSAHDALETARATKAFKFHLDLHLDKEDTHMYRLIGERVSPPEQGRAVGLMASHAPQDRFPEVVAWMFPLIGRDRVSMIRSWQMGMPPEAFAMAATLIEQAVGDDWTELALHIPELAAAHWNSTPRMEITMDTPHDLVADPSNAGQVGAWDGNEGDVLGRASASASTRPSRTVTARSSRRRAIGEDHRVLDVGCGNGQATRDVARIAVNGSALGVDLSSQMLAVADRRQPPRDSTTSSSATQTRRSFRSRTPRSTS